MDVHTKGNTTLIQSITREWDRYSLVLSIGKFNKSQRYYGLDKVALNNNICDSSFLRDYLCYDMMRSMDVSTPLCSFVQVKLNGEVIGLYTAVESLSESFALRNYGTQHGQLHKPEQMDIADMITGMEKNMFFLFRRFFYYTCRCGYVIIEAKDKVAICKSGGEACWICGTCRKIRGMDCRCKFNPEILKGLRASVYQRLALENGGKLRMSPTTKRSKTTRGIGGK